jgi:hypothetical protein
LPRKACEEGRRLEDHAPYDVYEAANRIGEVVVPSRRAPFVGLRAEQTRVTRPLEKARCTRL